VRALELERTALLSAVAAHRKIAASIQPSCNDDDSSADMDNEVATLTMKKLCSESHGIEGHRDLREKCKVLNEA